MATYSFIDVSATIAGVGGVVDLAYGAGSAAEGITIESAADKNVMLIGADGSGMHSLIANESSTVTCRFLKTSPVNQQLALMYNLQTRSSAFHGTNVITVRDSVRGDLITLTGVAFKKRPTLTYATEGGMNEWTFDAIKTVMVLGIGTPEI